MRGGEPTPASTPQVVTVQAPAVPPPSSLAPTPVAIPLAASAPPLRPPAPFNELSEDLELELVSREEFPAVADFDLLPPAQRQALEPVYQALDGALVDLGRKAVEILESGRIQVREVRKARSLAQKLQAHLDLEVAKRTAGFLAKFRKTTASPTEDILQVHLQEAFRELGELLIEQWISEQLRFQELDTEYRQVEDLFLQARATEK